MVRSDRRRTSGRQLAVCALIAALTATSLVSVPLLRGAIRAQATGGYSGAVLADSPALYYRLDEGSGPTAADSSGNGRNGTYGSGLTFGISGALLTDTDSAVAGSRSGTVVTVGASGLPSGGAARTFEAWFQTAEGRFQDLVDYGDFDLALANGNQIFLRNSSDHSLNTPYSVIDNRWHYLAASYDGAGTLTIYLDGQQLGTIGFSLNTSTSGSFLVGNGVSAPFNGGLDEVAMYPSALTAARLGQHWAAGVGATCPSVPTSGYAGAVAADHPVRYLRLGETGGRAAMDYSGNCRDGTYEYDAAHTSGALVNDVDGGAGTATSTGPMVLASADGLPSGNAARTAEAWFKTSTGLFQDILDYGDFDLALANGNQIFLRSASDHSVNTPYSLIDNRWHYVALAFDGVSTMTVYIDGQQLQTFGVTLSTAVSADLQIGDGVSGPFQGSLDEPALYAAALTPSQIGKHWAAGVAATCPPAPSTGYGAAVAADQPVRYIRLGEVTGRTAADYSSNCRHAAYEYDTGHVPGATVVDAGGGAATATSSGPMALASADGLPVGNSARTVEAWFKTATGLFEDIVDYGDFDIALANGNQIFLRSASDHNINTPYSVVDYRWHYLAMTYDGNGTMLVYLDNQPSQGLSLSLSTSTSGSLQLGNGVSRPFQGVLAEVAVYPTALSPGRIQAHFNAGTPAGGPVTDASMRGGGSQCLKCMLGSILHGGFGFPVDSANGNMYHSFTDFKIPGRGYPLALARTYNSSAAGTDAGLGYGWVDNYLVNLVVSGSTATLTEENGAQTVFTQNGSTWTAPPRVIATLTHNGDGTWTLVRNAQQTLVFNASGQLTSEHDLNGYTTTLAYAGGQLTTVTDAAARTLTMAYSGSHLASATDQTGRQVRYQYNDGASNLTDVFDVNGGQWHFTYDTSHRMKTMADPVGNTVTNDYDGQGRIDWQTDPKSQKTTFQYNGDETTITDPANNVTVDYHSQGVKIAETRGYGSPVAATWRFGYDPNTLQQTTAVDPNGHTTSATYDSQGNKLSQTDGLGRITAFTYNSLNEPLTVRDPNQVTTTMTYDAPGNLLTVSTPLVGSSPAQSRLTTYNHEDAQHPGDVTSVIDPDGKRWAYTYDQYGNRTSSADPLGDKATSTYNSLDWLLTQVTPKGNVTGCGCAAQYTTTYSYTDGQGHLDQYGDVQSVTDSLGHVTRWTYDADRNVHTVTDPDQHVTQNQYDLDNELTGVVRADNTSIRTDFNPDGTVKDQVDGNGKTTTYGYDQQARVTSQMTPPTAACSSGCTTSYSYDGAGNRITTLDPAGKTTTYTYDATNELKTISYGDGVTPNVTNIGYDNNGQRTAMSDGTGTSQWTWDSLHRLTSSQNGAGRTVTYGYDLRGHVTSIVYPGTTAPSVTRTYDDAGRITAVSDGLGHTTAFTPDPNSNVVTEAYPNQTTATMTPDATDRLSSISDSTTSSLGSPFSFSYTRDPNGQEMAVSSSGLQDNHSYAYTQLNQLGSDNGSAYRYDSADNLTNRPDGSVQQFDAANELTWTGHVTAAIAPVAAGNSAPTSFTQTVSLPAGITANDQIVVASTQVATGNSVQAVTDNLGGTYTSVQSVTSGGAAPTSTAVYRKLATGGETSVTVTYTGLTARAIVVSAYRGVDSSTPVDASATGASGTTNSTSVTAQVSSTSSPGDELVMLEGATGYAGTPGWTALGMTQETQTSQALAAAGLADQTVPTALPSGSDTGSRTASFGASAQLTAVLLALKPARTSYAYDSRGNRVSVSPPYGATGTTLSYDQANRLTSYGTSGTHAYNGDGLRMSKTVGGQNEAFTWDDAEGLPLLLEDGATSFVYGPGGLPLEQVTPKPTITMVGSPQTAGDATSTSLTVPLPSGTQAGDEVLVATTFPAGALGNNNAAMGQNYQLVDQNTSGGTAATQDVTEVYAKVAGASEGSAVVNYDGVFPKAAVVAAYHNTDPSGGIDVLTGGGQPNGSTVSASTTTRYPNEQLVAIQGATYTGLSSQSWSATAPAGLVERAQKDAGTVTIGVADVPQAPTGSTGSVTSTFSTTGQLTTAVIGLKTPPAVLFFHQDQIGSTRVLTDIAGAQRASYTYDPYGSVISKQGDAITPLQFNGQYRDAESGLTYLRARFYDSSSGQLLSRDPAAVSTRVPYGYAGNNPMNATDPAGLWCPASPGDCVQDVEQAGGAIAGGAQTVVNAAVDTTESAVSDFRSLCIRDPRGGDNDNGGCHTTLSTSQGRTGIGIALGAGATLTGVGAFADVGIFGLSSGALSTVSFVGGVGAGALDGPACLGGDRVACVGAGLGVVGGFGGLPDLVGGLFGVAEDSLLGGALKGISALGLNLGFIGTGSDITSLGLSALQGCSGK